MLPQFSDVSGTVQKREEATKLQQKLLAVFVATSRQGGGCALPTYFSKLGQCGF